MGKVHMRSALLVFVAGIGLSVYPGAARQPQAPAGGAAAGKPDILGITTGMAPQDALNLMRNHDPGHTVSLTQWTIPQIYGDKPITLGLSTATTGNELMWVQITLPPSPQVVWEVHREIPQFTSATPNVLKTLYDKYGKPWETYSPPGSPVKNPGQLQWLFDAQGRALPSPTTQVDSLAMQTCMGQVMQAWYSAFTNMPFQSPDPSHNFLVPGNPRTSVETMPPVYDLSRNTLCNNLIVVKALINGGNVQPGALQFTLNITIDDYTAQHRAGMALNDAFNAIVRQGAQKERDNASQHAVPKL